MLIFLDNKNKLSCLKSLYLSYFQIWRLITNYLFFGPVGFNFLFNMIFLYPSPSRVGSLGEQSSRVQECCCTCTQERLSSWEFSNASFTGVMNGLQGGLLLKCSRILPVIFVVLRICTSPILQVGADLVQEKIPGNFFVSWGHPLC